MCQAAQQLFDSNTDRLRTGCQIRQHQVIAIIPLTIHVFYVERFAVFIVYVFFLLNIYFHEPH